MLAPFAKPNTARSAPFLTDADNHARSLVSISDTVVIRHRHFSLDNAVAVTDTTARKRKGAGLSTAMNGGENQIAKFRKKAGLTLCALGEMIGVQKSAVHKWERGRPPSPSSAIQIERVTGIPRHDLRPDLWPRVEGDAA